ncbi:hypothetical protein [Ectopseudomonas mendocina]|uniref:hypothetical protein n=1 Tax=Ectopseudomonas mendocina TaxID=300 RepID=UPI0021B0D16A|nr:hypothetical protein [Pseudomonas mendocina]
MAKPMPAVPLEEFDKIHEAAMAELIGTTKKALERKRERGIIPLGVWCVIDGRVMYSKRRYNEWLESLWVCQEESRLSASPSASGSHGKAPRHLGAVKPSLSRPPRPGSPKPQVFVLT